MNLPTLPAVQTARPFAHRRRITYADCTVGNHVYYARYLHFVEEACGEFFRSLGWPLRRLQAEGFAFPVRECRLQFEAPARYDDEVVIKLRLAHLDRLWLKIDFTVDNMAGGTLVTGQTAHICASPEEKPRRMPRDLLAALSAFGGMEPPARASDRPAGVPPAEKEA